MHMRANEDGNEIDKLSKEEFLQAVSLYDSNREHLKKLLEKKFGAPVSEQLLKAIIAQGQIQIALLMNG